MSADETSSFEALFGALPKLKERVPGTVVLDETPPMVRLFHRLITLLKKENMQHRKSPRSNPLDRFPH